MMEDDWLVEQQGVWPRFRKAVRYSEDDELLTPRFSMDRQLIGYRLEVYSRAHGDACDICSMVTDTTRTSSNEREDIRFLAETPSITALQLTSAGGRLLLLLN